MGRERGYSSQNDKFKKTTKILKVKDSFKSDKLCLMYMIVLCSYVLIPMHQTRVMQYQYFKKTPCIVCQSQYFTFIFIIEMMFLKYTRFLDIPLEDFCLRNLIKFLNIHTFTFNPKSTS